MGRLVPIKGRDQRWDEEFEDYAFVPDPLPASLPLSESTYAVMADAAMALGRLDAATDRLPNPRLLVRPALRLEAVSTSALEGTYATLTDVLEGDFVEETRRSAELHSAIGEGRRRALPVRDTPSFQRRQWSPWQAHRCTAVDIQRGPSTPAAQHFSLAGAKAEPVSGSPPHG